MVAPVASLYVGDLDPTVSEIDLFKLFSNVGHVSSVRVCKDSISGASLGYGYVNFFYPHHAYTALKCLNYRDLKGSPIRIMWSHRDPYSRKTGMANLFIKNLDRSISNARLHEIFCKFGTILSCKVATQDGNSKGYGFVQFDSEEYANTAIEVVNGTLIEGKKVYVGKFLKKNQRGQVSIDAKLTNLYVNNLDLNLTEDTLRDKFSEFGKISSLVIAKNDQGNSKGFGFVSFHTPEDAKRAMEAMDGAKLGSKALYVRWAQKKAEREEFLKQQFQGRHKELTQEFQVSTVYVKNFDDSVDNDKLRELFSVCGQIISVKVMLDKKGDSRCFGFVCFSTPKEANNAVAKLNGTLFRGKPLYVALVQLKENRRKHLLLQHVEHTMNMLDSTCHAGYPTVYYSPLDTHRAITSSQHFSPNPGWRSSGSPPIGPGFQSISPQMAKYLNVNVSPQPKYQPSDVKISPVKNLMIRPDPSGPSYQKSGMWPCLLASETPGLQKQMDLEHLITRVQQLQYEDTGKIFDMLRKMDDSELCLLLESPELLTAWVENATRFLKSPIGKPAACRTTAKIAFD